MPAYRKMVVALRDAMAAVWVSKADCPYEVFEKAWPWTDEATRKALYTVPVHEMPLIMASTSYPELWRDIAKVRLLTGE